MSWDDWDAIDAAQQRAARLADAMAEQRRVQRLAERGMQLVPDAPRAAEAVPQPHDAIEASPWPPEAVPPRVAAAEPVDMVAGVRLYARALARMLTSQGHDVETEEENES
jgi:hypothetical protein